MTGSSAANGRWPSYATIGKLFMGTAVAGMLALQSWLVVTVGTIRVEQAQHDTDHKHVSSTLKELKAFAAEGDRCTQSECSNLGEAVEDLNENVTKLRERAARLESKVKAFPASVIEQNTQATIELQSAVAGLEATLDLLLSRFFGPQQ